MERKGINRKKWKDRKKKGKERMKQKDKNKVLISGLIPLRLLQDFWLSHLEFYLILGFDI